MGSHRDREPLLKSCDTPKGQADGPFSSSGGADGPLPTAAAAVVSERAALTRRIAGAIYLSLAANILLLGVKMASFFVSGSMAVLASAVDSLIDLASQAIISLADRSMSRKDARYPAGKARLEPISVLGCACIMTVGALLVIQESASKLWTGIRSGVLPSMELNPLMLCALGLATLLKLPLYCYCVALKQASGAAEALAEDHLNDVAANIGAIVTAAIAGLRPEQLWWVDPAGGILISVAIIWRWTIITLSSVAKVVGLTAPPDMIDAIRLIAAEHHPQTSAGFIRAYHAGQRLAVDIELEGPQDLSIFEAADISQGLKERLEALPEVEAASVVVVPLGTHTSPSQPALLLPNAVCKPPGAADVPGLAEAPLETLLASAVVATSPRAGTHAQSGAGAATVSVPTSPAAAPAAATWYERDLEVGGAGGGGSTTSAYAGLGSASVLGPPVLHASSGARGSPPRSMLPTSPLRPLSTTLRRMSAPAGFPSLLPPGSPHRRSSAARPGAAAEGLSAGAGSFAEHVAWMRALRDRPDRGLSSASFRRRDAPALLLASGSCSVDQADTALGSSPSL